MDMERLEKKATILFPPDLYSRLARLAERRGSSVGELVREACVAQYFRSSVRDRLAAVQEIAGLSLPVSSVEEMERESVLAPEALP
jgi:predicted DNA-binding protein